MDCRSTESPCIGAKTIADRHNQAYPLQQDVAAKEAGYGGAEVSHDGDALRREAREVLEALFSIAEAAAAVDDPDDLYGQIHAIVGRLMPARSFYIALTDDEMRTIRFPYFADERDTPPGPGARPFGHGLTEYAMRARRPLLADAAVLDDLVRAGEIDLLGQRSLDWMGAPVLVGGQALGVIVVQSYDPDVRYRPDDLEILAFVARMVALVLQRKRSEDVLVETNRSLAALVDNLPGVAFRCSNDPDWTMEYLSSGIRELTGWSATELLTSRGMNHASLIDAQDRQRVRDEVQRALDARRAWTLEYRISTADGTPRWIMERGPGSARAGASSPSRDSSPMSPSGTWRSASPRASPGGGARPGAPSRWDDSPRPWRTR